MTRSGSISLLSAWSLEELKTLIESTPPNTRSVLLKIQSDCKLAEKYLDTMTTKPPAYRCQIEQVTQAQNMVSGQLVTQLLQILIRISGAKKVLELGTLTGYSALAMAEVMPPDGRLITCDRHSTALPNFANVPWGAKIELKTGLIVDTLQELVRASWQFDLIFLDADKRNYSNYLKTILDGNLLRSGGILCADNTLFRGEVWQGQPSPLAQSIHEFNQLLAQDIRLTQVLLPLRDGLTIAYRL